VVATLDVSFPGGVHPVELRSRARPLPLTTAVATTCEWNERFLVSPPAGSGAMGPAPTRGYLSEVVVTAAVVDLHAAAGNGCELASTALALDELIMPGGDRSNGGHHSGDDDGDEVVPAAGAAFRGTLKLPLAYHQNGSGDATISDEATALTELELEVIVEVISAAELDSTGTSTSTTTVGYDCEGGVAMVSAAAAPTMASFASSLAGAPPTLAAHAVAIGFTPEGPWLPLTSLEASAGAGVGVSYVRVGGVVAALEESLMSSGIRQCTLRSLATFCNNTAVPLQICLTSAGRLPPGSGGDGGSGSSDGDGGHSSSSDPSSVFLTEEVFEHQRYIPLKGWSDKHLMVTERRRWSKRDGSASANDIDKFCYCGAVLLPEGWRWDGEWSVEIGHHCDGKGWGFGTSFLDLSYPFSPGRGSMGRASFVRMRRWVRRRSLVPSRAEDLAAAGTFSTVVTPGGTTALPIAAVGPDATVHLHVRRFVDHRGQQPQHPVLYNWGVRTAHAHVHGVGVSGREGGSGSRLLARAEAGLYFGLTPSCC